MIIMCRAQYAGFLPISQVKERIEYIKNYQNVKVNINSTPYREQIQTIFIQVFDMGCEASWFPLGKRILIVLQRFHFWPHFIIGGAQSSKKSQQNKNY